MSNFSNYIKGGAWLTGSQFVGHLCGFVRNIIIARILSPDDFGIAVIFALVVSVFEMISDLSFGVFIIQSDDGDDPEVQSTAHFLCITRSFLVFCFMVIFAVPLAGLFGMADIWKAFIVLAIIPLIKGFYHFDPRRYERSMRFGPSSVNELTAQILLVVLAYPAAYYFKDYRAMIFLMICRALISLIVSHLLAERKYSIKFQKRHIRKFLSFGWPLLINALLLFFIMQGDKLLIASSASLFGSAYGVVDVGFYSLAFMFAMMPSLIVDRVVSRLFLPEMSRRKKEPEIFADMYLQISEMAAFFGVNMLIILTFSGAPLLIFFYGAKYSTAAVYLPFFALLWFVRLLRIAPTQAAIAQGNTSVVMVTNIVRALAIPAVICLLKFDVDLIYIACAGIVGETMAYSTNVFLNYKNKTMTKKFLSLHFYLLIVVSTIFLINTFTEEIYLYVQKGIFALIVAAVFSISAFMFSQNMKVITKKVLDLLK